MQKLIIMMLLIVLPVLLIAQDEKKTTETVKFTTSITCNNCVNKIMTNLPQEKGIKDVKCNVATKEVVVTYQKDKNNPEQIIKSIEKLGFTAKEITTENSPKKDK